MSGSIDLPRLAIDGAGIIPLDYEKAYGEGSIGVEIKRSALRLRSKFSPLDDELILGGRTGDPVADLAVAQHNRGAIAACIARLNAALLDGVRLPSIVFPNAKVMVARAPFAGSAPPSLGVSAVGGGHYLGETLLPLSAGWSCHGIVFDGMSGFSIVSEGCEFITLENDPYNNESANDALHSMFFISRCSNVRVLGEFYGDGFQVDYAGTTSGNLMDISYGSTDIAVTALLRNFKGSNPLAVGYNRALGYGPVGVSGYDISQPCERIYVHRLESWVGEHGGFIGPCADQVEIGSVHVHFEPYSYDGVPQGDYIQRGLYIQAGGRVRVGSVDIHGAHKAGVLIAAYDTRRSYRDGDIEIGSVYVRGAADQDANYHSGLEIYNHNQDPDHFRTVKIKVGSFTTRGVKSGIVERDDGLSSLSQKSCIQRLHVGAVDIEATANGIVLASSGQQRDISIGDGTITVAADASYSATSAPVQGLTIRSDAAVDGSGIGTLFTEDVRLGRLVVTSGNRCVTIGGASGVTIDGVVANYVEQGVPGANNKPLTITYSRRYGSMDFRTSDGSPASQQDVLEFAPMPIRGAYSRSFVTPITALAPGDRAISSRTLLGLRSVHNHCANLIGQPDLAVETVYEADDTLSVIYTNRGASPFTGDVTTNVIAFAQQVLGGS